MTIATKQPRVRPAITGPTLDADQSLPRYAPRSTSLHGRIRLVHSDRTLGIVPLWIEAFRAHHPGVEVETLVIASGVAAQALAEGEADLAFIGREMLEAERDVFAIHFGGQPRRFAGAGGNLDLPGTTHAVAMYVNAGNPLGSLSLDQLDAVFSTTGRRGLPSVRTWGGLGVGGDWVHQPIKLWGQTPDIGFDRYVQERALLGGDYREDIELLDQVDTIPQRVADDRYAIGYAGFGHRVPGAKVLALAEDARSVPVACTLEDVASQRYPFSRRLYLFAPGTGTEPLSAATAEFLSLVLSLEGQQAVAEDGLFLPLPPTVVSADRQTLTTITPRAWGKPVSDR